MRTQTLKRLFMITLLYITKRENQIIKNKKVREGAGIQYQHRKREREMYL